ncbi:[FeFe] hydrogenase H-cluster radical SAM maturase HydE [Pseudodesulfovibrio sp. F-1]|uniref:[FeFe] hydrogenase H-cluster radical SAM maturase HydE n=1 Tax=Pseudodesulfovibrio alkaliphilus TaxID=2661613 RepID=A0A7K1KNU2_9BACT|nr:radical SAM protein [Pseudodesulfovibrio alkaliphilus]MUM77765.1 [FeFe] hydrogenase H-cluster radical SAM maturase HydE [Pseudodesulfovibrio alkaliphilus]
MNTHDILALLNGSDDLALFADAALTHRRVFGDEVFIRAVVEFSNVCNKKCHYCGLRAPNAKLRRYRMSAPEILDTACAAASDGAGTVVLQSGDDTGYDTALIGDLIRQIKASHSVAVTLSLGDRGIDEYAFWRDCGADRCLIKVETSNPRLYKRLRQGEDFSARLRRVEAMRQMGYEVGSGVIAGLPGATLLDAARDILLLTDLGLEMIAVGPFVPNPDTPLAASPPGHVALSHRMTALLRTLNPEANIPATTALDALDPSSRALALARGCNVLMPSMTPADHRGDYTIYPGKNADAIDDPLAEARRSILATGFIPSSSMGFSPRSNHVQQGTTRCAAGHRPGRTAQRGQIIAD